MNQGYPEGLGIQVGGNAYSPAGQVLEGQYFYEPEAVPEKDANYMPIACMQCEKPPCVKVCPVRTTYREGDGPVVIDYNWCIGCKMCMNACPYWARRFNLTTPVLPKEAMNPVTHYLGNRPRMRGVVEKCHWCLQRSRHGRYPACVEVCPVGARKFGNLLDPESEVSMVLAAEERVPPEGRAQHLPEVLLLLRLRRRTVLLKFVSDYVRYVLKGGAKFYAWMGTLSLLIVGMLYVYYLQNTEGLIVTGMTSQIHDGLYLANLVFLVGVAAGAVTIVFPAYVYHHEGMHKVTVLGEMLAISAVIMVMMFVFAHMGRPDRLWHMVPPFGIYSFSSMLGWDVLVLNGYLILNFVVGFWYLYSKYTGKPVNKKIFMPLVYVSIVWALSIHTVTAFLLATNPARPMWFHSMMPIRFIATAFAAGPALIILAFLIIRNNTKFWIEDSAIKLLATIVTFCLGIAIFLTLSEIVVELYARTEHANGLYYLMFGLHGLTNLVPWFWSSVVLMLVSFVMFLMPSFRNNLKLLPIPCAMAFAGIWIEKGMGLVVPGFIPTPIGEVTEYYPTFVEWLLTAGHLGLRLLHPDHPAQGRHRHPAGRHQVRRQPGRRGEVR
jgi:Fe-S-cluster-containing dehydrogenase component/Ni/Fe-hydrogenase subunit HybB-like protein